MTSHQSSADVVLDDVVAVIGQYVDLSGCEVGRDSVLGEDVPLDSAQMLRVLTRLEAVRGVRFRPEDLLKLRTVGDLAALVRRGSRRS